MVRGKEEGLLCQTAASASPDVLQEVLHFCMHRKKSFKGKVVMQGKGAFKGMLRKSGQLCWHCGNETVFPVAVVGLNWSELARAGRVLVGLVGFWWGW